MQEYNVFPLYIIICNTGSIIWNRFYFKLNVNGNLVSLDTLINWLSFFTSQFIYGYIAIWSGYAVFYILEVWRKQSYFTLCTGKKKNNAPCLQLISALLTYFLLMNTFTDWQKCRRNVSITLCILLYNTITVLCDSQLTTTYRSTA